jgi:hypothetical protein
MLLEKVEDLCHQGYHVTTSDSKVQFKLTDWYFECLFKKKLTCYSYNFRDLSRNLIHEIHSRAFAKLGPITNL